jgi:hypothetical protein
MGARLFVFAITSAVDAADDDDAATSAVEADSSDQ